jgi:hypothetical protein
MPKDTINYSSTIIYKIVCKDLNITDLYVGHTTNFIKRKQSHKKNCKNPSSKSYNLKVYSTIRDNGNWDNWDMIEIEKYNCNDRNEAAARERYWYETLHAKLNIVYPQRSNKEYRIDNKEKILLKKKEYRINNKEIIQEYRENNKEKNILYHVEYRKNNKEKLKEHKYKICNCEICGKDYTHNHKSRHEKTIFHLSKLDEIK